MTYLDLSDNKIGNLGATALAEGLKLNGAMTKLDLSWNQIGDTGATGLCEGPHRHAQMAQLKLVQPTRLVGNRGGNRVKMGAARQPAAAKAHARLARA